MSCMRSLGLVLKINHAARGFTLQQILKIFGEDRIGVTGGIYPLHLLFCTPIEDNLAT